MKKHLLTKTLLLATGLLVGASAWADDYYNVTRYSQDYEDATNYTTGWTLGSNVVAALSSIDGTSQLYLNMNSKNKAQRDNTLALSTVNAYFGSVDEYEFSFQYGYSHGNQNAYDNGMTLYGPEESVLFTIKQPGNYASGGNAIYDAENTSLATFTSEYNKSSKGVFLTFTITGSKSSNNVKLTVLNGISKIVDNVTISKTFKTIDNIYLQMTGGASHYFFDNMVLKEHSETAVAEDPSFTFNKVSGENRVYTIKNPNASGTLYYTTVTAETAPAVGDAAYSSTTESSIDVPFATGTYYAYAVLEDGTTTSAIVSQSVTGGAITLEKPYYTIVSYNETTAKTTITLNTDVSGLLGTPTATIKYTIDEGAEQSTSNGGSVEVADGSTISFYAEANGYSKSETVSAEATAPNTNPQLWKETYSGGGGSITLSSDPVVTVNTTKYYYMFEGETQISERLLSNSTPANFLYRSSGIYTGGGVALAINNVNVGDYITIEGAYGNGAFSVTGSTTDLTADTWHTIEGSKYTFTVKRAGEARFTFNRYGYLKSITVQRALSTAGATIGSTGYATFAADVALDLSTLTDGFTAYFASSAADGVVKMAKVTNEKIAAGEGLFIQGSGAFTITETRAETADVDNLLVAGDGVEGGVAKEDGYNKYVLGASGNSAAFFLIDETAATVPTNKAYLRVPTTAGESARSLKISFGDETTGISATLNDKGQMANDNVYNLNGQRVAQPSKGLFIVRSAQGGKNGMKVIIK